MMYILTVKDNYYSNTSKQCPGSSPKRKTKSYKTLKYKISTNQMAQYTFYLQINYPI